MLFGLLLRCMATDFTREVVSGSDGAAYSYAAKNLLKYGTLTYDRDGAMFRGETPVVPSNIIMPGLPVFLALVYTINDDISFVFMVQILLSMITLLLIYKIMRQVGVSFPIAAGVLLAAAVYPAFCYNLDVLLTETLFTTLLSGAIYCFLLSLWREIHKTKWLVGANLLLMCAVMVRAQALPFLVVELFFLLVYQSGTRKYRFVSSGLVVGIALVFFVPLWVRNWSQFQQFWLLTAAGDGPKIWGGQPYFLDMPSTNGRELAELVSSNIQAAPATYWKWRIFGFFQFMWYDMWDERLVHPLQLLAPFRLLQPLVVIPAVTAIPFLVRKARYEVLLLASVPILFTLMDMPYHGLPRYVFPAIPAVFVLVGVLLQTLVRRIKRQPNEIQTTAVSLNGWRHRVDAIFRWGYLVASCLFSLILIYSVYLFSWQVSREMSNYYLGRSYGVTTDMVENFEILSDVELSKQTSTWYVDNVTQTDTGELTGAWDTTPIMHIQIPTDLLQRNTNIVTKVILDIPGGYWYDNCTIYWVGDRTSEFSEACVFGRFPRNRFSSTQTVYIDENVTGLMVVPVGFRGGAFAVDGIQVTKYLVPER